jgi:predicted DsbA family dithiol-disulfide isomerase
MPDTERPIVQIDIISDVVCPWCIVGFRQLEQALGQTGFGARVRWHPFELNPDMAPEGEGLADHMQRKYGATLAQSRENRRRLADLGASLQIAFNFEDDSRIVNTFKAHKLLDYAASKGLQHPLKLALFNAYFSEGRDVSRDDTLIDVAETVGLKRDAAKAAIGSEEHANAVRAQEDLWSQSGISGVPTMIFAEKYLVTGAQGAEAYARVLQKAATEAA